MATLHKTMRVRATSLPNPELLEVPSKRLATLIMVADGVGGANAGEQASRAALESIATYVTETMLLPGGSLGRTRVYRCVAEGGGGVP